MATTKNKIYYPDDYNSAADVPGDMKKLAESVDANIEDIEDENYKRDFDIEKLQQDVFQTQEDLYDNLEPQVANIKQEQTTQNTNIEKLQENDTKQDELISKLKSAALNAETEESKSLYVTDANKFGQLEVFGNHEQETREGYNILDYLSNIRSSINGLTIDKDEETGYITVNGTPTENYTVISMDSAFSLTNILEDGQTYTLWQENHAENDAKGMYLQFRIVKISDGSEQYINSSKVNKTFTVDKSLYGYTASIQTGTKTQAGTFSNYKNRYMIYKGTDEKEFELYGATPSPDYPSEVKCLGSNKQLFDKSTAVEGLLQGDGTLSYSDNNYSTSDFIKVVPKKSYYKTITGSSRFKFFDEEKSPISSTYNDLIAPTKAQSFEIPENAHYIRFTFLKIYIDEIKIEEGTEATSYSPYGQGSTKISKINKNLAIAQNGIWYNYTNVSSDVQGYAYIARIKENSKITISKKNAGNRFAVFTSKEKIEVGAEMTQILVEQNTSRKEYTFNNVDGKWLFFGYYRGTDIEEAQLAGEEVQIEFEDTTTKYIEHQQEDYLLYIQQEMLKGDYFAKEADGWKEVHLRGKRYILNDIENAEFDGSGNLLLVSQLLKNIAKLPSNNSADINVISNVSEHSSYQALYDGDVDYGIAISYVGSLGIRIKDCSSLEEYKNKLNNEDFYYYYYLAIPTKLACTEEQSAVLEELNNLDLYKPVTNIITAEDIALLNLKYALDVETYVDNKLNTINQQILEIAGGN